jgi:hypothetical protein
MGAAVICPQTADTRRINASFPQDPCGSFLPMIIAFLFAAIVYMLLQLDLIMTQKLFTGTYDQALVTKIKTTLSDKISHNFTTFYLLEKN